ncbi:MAG: NADH-quinone oxidoreductase subunit N [Proteobacteria bacterium]|nr:NADH-quinone oxidoreductase subunit N [Pseudomonadota bacterium]
MIELPNIQLAAIYPEIAVLLLAFVVLAVDFVVPANKKSTLGYLTIAGLVLLLIYMPFAYISNEATFSGMVLSDSYAILFEWIFILAALFTVIHSIHYLKLERIRTGEYYQFVLYATLGMMVMAKGNDLMAIYVGLELMSISLYIMSAIGKDRIRSTEAAMKYLILGALASGILLFGMSYIYGLTGSTNLYAISSSLQSGNNNFLIYTGILLVAVGFSFKMALVPFHSWAPDVYEGAPTSVTAFMSSGPKAAALAIFLRVFVESFHGFEEQWTLFLWFFSAASMLFGSIVAISQKNIIRMLAYSSITHAGTIMLGLLAFNELGIASAVYYMMVYLFMNMGAFGVVIFIRYKEDRGEDINIFCGLGKTHPVAAFLLTLFLLSLAGIPPTGGFVVKFYVFSSAIQAGYLWLVIIAALSTVISLYYYLRVIVFMYMKEPAEGQSVNTTPLQWSAVAISAVFTIVMGVIPAPFMGWATAAVKGLISSFHSF